ncbi:MAG: chorismate-binding protein, partial [Gammaproteobacteria bacterium]
MAGRQSEGLGFTNVCRVDSMADLLRLHELQPTRYPHLLQSALTGTPQSRFDILFAFPGSSVESHPSDSQPFLSVLDQGWAESRIPKPIDASLERLPFRGGWFIYLGYELANEIEPSLDLPGFDLGLPTAFMTRFPAAIIRDHEQQCLWLVSEDGSHLDDMDSDLRLLGPELDTTADASTSRLGDDLEEDEPSAYLQGVSKIRDYIRDGDVFQVNLARRWWVRIDQRIKHSRVFRSLRQHNPAPFSALVTAGERAIISSSPERLVEVKDGLAITRPIAGTRPRGADGGGEPSVSDE